MNHQVWRIRDRQLSLTERCLIMGIVNVTPDSFSDGGRYTDIGAAIAHALQLVEAGADILDIGGESTRPSAAPVSLDEELRRVLPVVEGIVSRTRTPISLDTSKAEVAKRGLEAGAHIINDVTAVLGDPSMIDVANQFAPGLVIMHMQGTPATMQLAPNYGDVVSEVRGFLRERVEMLTKSGCPRETIVIDPGIGFGKTLEHNLELLANLDAFRGLDQPICLGVSRKGMLGQITGRSRDQRIVAGASVLCFGLAHHAVQIVRVHDVAETRDAVLMWEALRRHRR